MPTPQQIEDATKTIAEMIRPQSEDKITANTWFRAQEIVRSVIAKLSE